MNAKKAQGIENKRPSPKVEPTPSADDGVPGWEAELGTRIATVLDHLGRDKSVQMTERSWKQLQRYAKGDDVPVAVLKGLADAAGLSFGYLIDGVVQVSADANMQRRIIDKQITRLSREEGAASSAIFQQLLERSAFFGRLGAALLNRPRYPHSYQHLIEGKHDPSLGPIDPAVVREILEYAGVAEDQAPYTAPGGDSFVGVPRYDVRLSAGAGAFSDRVRVLDRIPFTERFLRRKLGRSGADGLVIVEVAGDSMEPTIGDGDLVMVDTQDQLVVDGLFALVLDDTLVVKRLRRVAGGLEVISDNAAHYPPVRFGGADAASVQVIGRVRWIGRVL